MTLWLFIGRLNPPHNWHIVTIEKSLKENDLTLVLLWTPKNIDENNPFLFLERKKLLEKIFKNNDKIKFIELKDNISNLVWIYNIYKILNKNGLWINNVNFYWWDFENDSAYLVLKKFEKILLGYKLSYIENSRKNSFIEFEWKKYNISWTNLRKALEQQKYDLAQKFTKKEILEEIISCFNNKKNKSVKRKKEVFPEK